MGLLARIEAGLAILLAGIFEPPVNQVSGSVPPPIRGLGAAGAIFAMVTLWDVRAKAQDGVG